MKAILISIKPNWVEKILKGEKTIEIRKTMPKCDLPIDVYIYCTNDRKKLVYHDLTKGGRTFTYDKEFSYHENDLNGKVVAKFTLNDVETMTKQECELAYHLNSKRYNKILEKSCLNKTELSNYLQDKMGYAWHISNLVVFDKPKELSEFKTIRKINGCSGCKYLDTNTYEHCIKCEEIKPLTKAPQSWCYIEVEVDD